FTNKTAVFNHAADAETASLRHLPARHLSRCKEEHEITLKGIQDQHRRHRQDEHPQADKSKAFMPWFHRRLLTTTRAVRRASQPVDATRPTLPIPCITLWPQMKSTHRARNL